MIPSKLSLEEEEEAIQTPYLTERGKENSRAEHHFPPGMSAKRRKVSTCWCSASQVHKSSSSLTVSEHASFSHRGLRMWIFISGSGWEAKFLIRHMLHIISFFILLRSVSHWFGLKGGGRAWRDGWTVPMPRDQMAEGGREGRNPPFLQPGPVSQYHILFSHRNQHPPPVLVSPWLFFSQPGSGLDESPQCLYPHFL